MSTDRAIGFSDNWGYLRTEFNWLDRVLRLAIARRQREKKAVERVAKNSGDRATSDWWKGLVTLEGNIGRDELPKLDVFPAQTESLPYQQQLAEKIQASYQEKVSLGLPMLCDRAQLTLFEKQLVLTSLAPEVNQRYSRMYQYLQDNDRTHLPTVDLILRLFCRGDRQWREAREQIVSSSSLTQLGLVQFLPSNSETFLHSRVKLADPLVNYLLADRPNPEVLQQLLSPELRQPQFTTSYIPNQSWSDLILPPTLLDRLHYLSQNWQLQAHLAHLWRSRRRDRPGQVIAFVGASGTGKTTALEAIATELHQRLTAIDLHLWPNPISELPDLYALNAPILLIESAHLWFKRSHQPEIRHLLLHRQQQQAITILSVHPQFQGTHVLKQWVVDRVVKQVLDFPIPNKSDRLKLWQQTFPSHIPIHPGLNWEQLAQRWTLTGGEIEDIAYQATVLAAIESPDTPITLEHIQQAYSITYSRSRRTIKKS